MASCACPVPTHACTHAPAHRHAATLVGCAPNNFVAANAGAHIGELTSMSDLVSYKLMAFMGVIGILGEGLGARACC